MWSVCVLLVGTHALFFFFNDTATTEIYTLSLHDALPISDAEGIQVGEVARADGGREPVPGALEGDDVRELEAARAERDRKSTRLNSSHANISYAVFCLKKKRRAARSPLAMPTSGSLRV